jgi:hypothetical protein
MMTSQMTDQHKEEALSRAFVHAIAARAGAIVSIWDFDYGIDGSFHEIAIIDGSKSIHIPRSQHFTPETLNTQFQQFSRG